MTEDLSKFVDLLDIAADKISCTLTELTAAKQQKEQKEKMSTKSAFKTELIGHKWTIEHYVDEKEVIELKDTENRQAVYVYRCKNSTISIPAKVTAITLDSCENVALLVENVIASLEIISSKKVQCQILGVCPTISIDNTAGVMLYLSDQCIDLTQIFSAKSTEMNILFKTASMKEEDDMLELPIPEQFMTKINKNGTLVTEAVQHV